VHGWQLLTWNLWVAIGIVMYLALIAVAIAGWRRRPRRQLTVVTPEKSPIDALLARADAVLRGGTLVGVPGQDDKSAGSSQANASWKAGSNGEISGARDGAPASDSQVGADSGARDPDAGASQPPVMPRPAR
jgi:hypothetical protein